MRFFVALLMVCGFSIARATTGTQKVHNFDEVDVKVDVRSEDIAATLLKWNLQEDDAEKIRLYFFDTPDLKLFSQHLTVRGRLGEKSDLQVKIRPAVASLDSEWFQLKGFKCKYDQTKSTMIPDCALKSKLAEEDLTSAAEGTTNVENLLTGDQLNYAELAGLPSIPWGQVKPLGPIEAKAWEITAKNGHTVDVETWTLPGYQFLEVSEHCPTGEQEATRAEILDLLQQIQVQESAVGQNKTEFVMKIFAGRKN